ncbi:uncharacterized protein LOC124154694 [Ischnura elegans]|uniref:uncharacterized protein LOC124154694 n=1 Tax=Ischnura elegans TaxID=197161 RepID=UPI001ED86922|nr:uncharacterized protein LOC124154694 [Ischnura elegans]
MSRTDSLRLAALLLLVHVFSAFAQSGKVVFGDAPKEAPAAAAEEARAYPGPLRYASTAPDLGGPNANFSSREAPPGGRRGKNLLNWLGLGTGPETDPYLAAANEQCLVGDLSECFKSRALSSLDEFFLTSSTSFPLTENARIRRYKAPGADEEARHGRSFEFSAQPRAADSEWDRFVKFLLRRVEVFIKSAGLELEFPSQVTAGGRYTPRFIEDIATEIDLIEDKNDPALSRTKLKKLFIPLLVILKLFKLKLLLFLPLILGLASFKKVLGFLALVIPGVIGFFKLCKPELSHNYGSFGHSSFYQPPPQSYNNPYSTYYASRDHAPSSPSVAFREPPKTNDYDAHNLAYQGYSEYHQK